MVAYLRLVVCNLFLILPSVLCINHINPHVTATVQDRFISEEEYVEIPLQAPKSHLVAVYPFHIQLGSHEPFVPKLFLAYHASGIFGGRGLAQLHIQQHAPHHSGSPAFGHRSDRRLDQRERAQREKREIEDDFIGIDPDIMKDDFVVKDQVGSEVIKGNINNDMFIEGSGLDESTEDTEDNEFSTVNVIKETAIPVDHVPTKEPRYYELITYYYILYISYHGRSNYVCSLRQFMDKEISRVTIESFPTDLIFGSEYGTYQVHLRSNEPLIPHRKIVFVPETIPAIEPTKEVETPGLPITTAVPTTTEETTTAYHYWKHITRGVDEEAGRGVWQEPTVPGSDGTSWIPLLVILGGVVLFLAIWYFRRRMRRMVKKQVQAKKVEDEEEFCECD